MPFVTLCTLMLMLNIKSQNLQKKKSQGIASRRYLIIAIAASELGQTK